MEVRPFDSYEQRKSTKWVSADKWRVNPFVALHPNEPSEAGEFVVLPEDRAIDQNLFERSERDILVAALGGSNMEGLAPVSSSKGVPEDCCKEIKKEIDRWGEEGFSHSYLSLKELINYDWSQKVKVEKYVENSKVDSFIDTVGIDNIIEIEVREVPFTKIVCNMQIKYAMPNCLEIISKMNERISMNLGQNHEDVRIVFWFSI